MLINWSRVSRAIILLIVGSGISRPSISYIRSPSTTCCAQAADPSERSSGSAPDIPAINQYALVRSNSRALNILRTSSLAAHRYSCGRQSISMHTATSSCSQPAALAISLGSILSSSDISPPLAQANKNVQISNRKKMPRMAVSPHHFIASFHLVSPTTGHVRSSPHSLSNNNNIIGDQKTNSRYECRNFAGVR